MARRLEIWLNDQALRDVDRRIIIRELHDNAPQIEAVWGDNPGRSGQRLIDLKRVTKSIGIEIAIRELYDLGARQSVLDAVNAWARDGWLRTNTQPGRRIYVTATGWPSMDNAREYTGTYTIGFTAAASPYWEDDIPMTYSGSGASLSGRVTNRGTADALPDVTITPTAGTLTHAEITVGATVFTFGGFALDAGDALTIRHDERGFLRINAAGASAFGFRTAQSDDELIASPGINDVTFEGDAACDVSVAVRGRYK